MGSRRHRRVTAGETTAACSRGLKTGRILVVWVCFSHLLTESCSQ